MKFRFPRMAPTPLSKLIKHASTDAIDLIAATCQWDPRKRPTAIECLQHPYFQTAIRPPPSLSSASRAASQELNRRRSSLGLSPNVISYGQHAQKSRTLGRASSQKTVVTEPQPLVPRRMSSKEIEPLIGHKISLQSQNAEGDAISLPPLLRQQPTMDQNRTAFKLMPLNHQKKSPISLKKRLSKSFCFQTNSRQFSHA